MTKCNTTGKKTGLTDDGRAARKRRGKIKENWWQTCSQRWGNQCITLTHKHEHEWTCCQGDKRLQRPCPPLPCSTQWCHRLPPALGGPLANRTKALEGAPCPCLFFLLSFYSFSFIRCSLTRPLVFCPSFFFDLFNSASGRLHKLTL